MKFSVLEKLTKLNDAWRVVIVANRRNECLSTCGVAYALDMHGHSYPYPGLSNLCG